jgi:hypothetical protein
MRPVDRQAGEGRRRGGRQHHHVALEREGRKGILTEAVGGLRFDDVGLVEIAGVDDVAAPGRGVD